MLPERESKGWEAKTIALVNVGAKCNPELQIQENTEIRTSDYRIVPVYSSHFTFIPDAFHYLKSCKTQIFYKLEFYRKSKE